MKAAGPAEDRLSPSANLGASMMAGVAQVRGGRRGAGAGFTWSPDGLVMTNHHVVAGSARRGNPGVFLTDGRSFDAEVVGSSRRLDLAMLRLRGESGNLPTLPVGDSDALRVGELIFAVGHPWGRVGAVTAGLVSGLGEVGGFGDRFVRGRRFVQSDAYLAPGNSGGPLVNARGEVIGVNAMIFGDLALAIPINTAGAWAETLAGGERPGRSYLGIRAQTVAPQPRRRRKRRATGSSGDLPETGVLVVDIEVGSPADRAGLLVGDVLLAVAGEPVGAAEDLPEALAEGAPEEGAPVRLSLLRVGRIVEVEAVPNLLRDDGEEPGRGA